MSDYYYLLRFDLSAPEDRQSNSELVCDGDEYRFGEIPLWLDRDDTSCPEREERRRLLSMITIDIKDKGLVRQQGCKKALPFIQELSGKKCHVSSLDKPVFACLPHLHNHRLDWYTAGRL
jgi:hypothetical protein